jgi:hypothetical protein
MSSYNSIDGRCSTNIEHVAIAATFISHPIFILAAASSFILFLVDWYPTTNVQGKKEEVYYWKI